MSDTAQSLRSQEGSVVKVVCATSIAGFFLYSYYKHWRSQGGRTNHFNNTLTTLASCEIGFTRKFLAAPLS